MWEQTQPAKENGVLCSKTRTRWFTYRIFQTFACCIIKKLLIRLIKVDYLFQWKAFQSKWNRSLWNKLNQCLMEKNQRLVKVLLIGLNEVVWFAAFKKCLDHTIFVSSSILFIVEDLSSQFPDFSYFVSSFEGGTVHVFGVWGRCWWRQAVVVWWLWWQLPHILSYPTTPWCPQRRLEMPKVPGTGDWRSHYNSLKPQYLFLSFIKTMIFLCIYLKRIVYGHGEKGCSTSIYYK